MPHKEHTPRQERAWNTRRKILQAAAEVFDERGYVATGMAQILDRAGVTKGALYFHFGSKEDLAREIVREDEKRATAYLSHIEPSLQGAIDMSHAFARSLQTDPAARASVRLAIEYGTFTAASDLTTYTLWIDKLHDVLIAAERHGDLRPEVDIPALAETVVGSFTGIQILSQVMRQREDLPKRVTDFWTFMLPGIAQPRRRARFNPAGVMVPGVQPHPDGG